MTKSKRSLLINIFYNLFQIYHQYHCLDDLLEKLSISENHKLSGKYLDLMAIFLANKLVAACAYNKDTIENITSKIYTSPMVGSINLPSFISSKNEEQNKHQQHLKWMSIKVFTIPLNYRLYYILHYKCISILQLF